ncbi:MAG: serine hydrolase [Rickettsiales bacterium]|nr:serine hydrolase [Rickettsiales bacterium]
MPETEDVILSSIASDCFDKFFSKEKLNLENRVLKNDLCKLLKEALSEKGSETAKVDEIKSKEDLIQILSEVDSKYLGQIDRSYLRGKHNITDLPSLESGKDIASPSNQKILQEYIEDKSLSVVASLSQGDSSFLVSSAKDLNSKSIFNINSVGKIVTGSLVMKMVQDGVFTEEQLKQPFQFDQDVLKELPESVQERLKTATLHELMTHKSGLKDYIKGYIGAIEDDIEKGENSFSTKSKTEDLLKFADEEVLSQEDLDDPAIPKNKKYSNLGIALVGLAIQQAYNDKYSKEHTSEEPYQPLSFDEIRDKYILEPAKITIFSNYMPEGGCAHPDDPASPRIIGAPDGGQWTDLESLNKFAKWFCDEWKTPKDGDAPSFKELVEKYGQEFYNSERGLVEHNGSGPTASAYLSIFPETETVFASVANNRFDAIVMHDLLMPRLEVEQVIKEDNTPQTFVERFCGDRKSKEAEDILTSKRSWVEVISDSKRAKDDSEIVR